MSCKYRLIKLPQDQRYLKGIWVVCYLYSHEFSLRGGNLTEQQQRQIADPAAFARAVARAVAKDRRRMLSCAPPLFRVESSVLNALQKSLSRTAATARARWPVTRAAL